MGSHGRTHGRRTYPGITGPSNDTWRSATHPSPTPRNNRAPRLLRGARRCWERVSRSGCVALFHRLLSYAIVMGALGGGNERSPYLFRRLGNQEKKGIWHGHFDGQPLDEDLRRGRGGHPRLRRRVLQRGRGRVRGHRGLLGLGQVHPAASPATTCPTPYPQAAGCLGTKRLSSPRSTTPSAAPPTGKRAKRCAFKARGSGARSSLALS